MGALPPSRLWGATPPEYFPNSEAAGPGSKAQAVTSIAA